MWHAVDPADAAKRKFNRSGHGNMGSPRGSPAGTRPAGDGPDPCFMDVDIDRSAADRARARLRRPPSGQRLRPATIS